MVLSDFTEIHLLPEEEASLRRYAVLNQIPDDSPHIKTFQRLGFISKVDTRRDVYGAAHGGRLIVSDEGRRFLNYLDDKTKDRRWTRGLAMAAIIISVLALCVSVLSLWLQWKSR